jgi:hypothetical protein
MISPLLFWIRTGLFVLGAVLLCFFSYFFFKEYQLTHFEKKITSEPIQRRIFFGTKWIKDEFQIIPRAEYKIAGKIMSTNPIKDSLTLSPLDFAITWGPMTDEDILKYFSWRHDGRILFRDFRSDVPLATEIIETHSGNIHAIPANEEIFKKLEEISAGDEVYLYGILVDVKNIKNGQVFKTSLSRNDWGFAFGASCELFWIEEVEILAKAPKKPSPQNISQNEDNVENATFEVLIPKEKQGIRSEEN